MSYRDRDRRETQTQYTQSHQRPERKEAEAAQLSLSLSICLSLSIQFSQSEPDSAFSVCNSLSRRSFSFVVRSSAIFSFSFSVISHQCRVISLGAASPLFVLPCLLLHSVSALLACSRARAIAFRFPLSARIRGGGGGAGR